MPLEVIEPRRLYRLIADQVRHLIDEGEYPPGSRLPTERELADRLGVSRPTVREALIALEVEGRLKIRVGSGIFVTRHRPAAVGVGSQSIEAPFELLAARAFVEGAIAEEAARMARRKDVARIDAVLDEVERLRRGGEAFLALDRRFHVAVATTMGNAVLVRVVGELFDLRINPYFERLGQLTLEAHAWRAAHEEHRLIRDAIAARDATAASTAMREHLQRSHDRFARDFGEVAAAASQDTMTWMRPQKVRPRGPQRLKAYGKAGKSAVS